MGETKKFILSLPNALLEKVDIISMEKENRNKFTKEARKLYIKEKKQMEVYEILRDGYMEMSQINLTLAEEGLEQDVLELDIYESRITGWGKI